MSLDKYKFESMHQEIQAQLDKLKHEEENLFQDINHMMNQKLFLNGKIKNLKKLLPTLKVVKHEAEELVATINDISESSEKISGKIRALDAARSRVTECQHRVGDLIDLEICSQGVQTAILESDYETGAAHVHRFLSIDQSLLKRTAADVENVSDMMKSVRTLQEACSQLQAIVEHKFNEAVKNEDLPAIERFFKIFPLLKMHEEGIKALCTFLRTKISATADKNLKSAMTTSLSDKRYSVVYADTLTLLFEGLARIVDTHQPLIETYYGPGRLLCAINILQKECDIQMKRILIEWTKVRQIHKKVQLINDLQRGGKMDKIDPKDMDILIGEITLMHFRTELYIRFIQRKVTSDLEIGVQDPDEKAKVSKSLENLIKNSDLTHSKHELLLHYLRLDQYFMEESVAKAVAMDTTEPAQQTSSMVDDTFFIVKKCIRRSISTGSLDGICAIINNACRVLESDFCDVLRTRLRQGYPSGYLDLTQAYNVLQSSIQQGRLQASDTEQTRTAFLVALNNADSSTEYVDALCNNVLKEIEQALPTMNTNERGKLESCLSGLSSVTTNLKEIIEYGIQQLRVSAIKPRINPWVDTFISINHQLSEINNYNEETLMQRMSQKETAILKGKPGILVSTIEKQDELSVYEAGESFVQTLIMNLETLLSAFKDVLTTANYDAFIAVLTSEVTQRLEKVIMKSSFNRLGGLILDKEVRSLAGYITATTSWSVRDKFARLTQIATVLNLENVSEIYDYWGEHAGALTWRLTPSELRTVMALRSDFKIEDIKRLKL